MNITKMPSVFRSPGLSELLNYKTIKQRSTATVPQSGQKNTVQLSFRDVFMAEEMGYFEVNGEQVEVPEEMRSAVREAYDTAMAYQQAVQVRKTAIANAEAARQQSKAMEAQAKSLKQAMEIAKRISKGGRVPANDEQFLLQYSQEMYMAAKMVALLAKKHEKHDSVLEQEENGEEGNMGEGSDTTADCVEAEFSGGDVPTLEGVSTVACDIAI